MKKIQIITHSFVYVPNFLAAITAREVWSGCMDNDCQDRAVKGLFMARTALSRRNFTLVVGFLAGRGSATLTIDCTANPSEGGIITFVLKEMFPKYAVVASRGTAEEATELVLGQSVVVIVDGELKPLVYRLSDYAVATGAEGPWELTV